jgi:hypothetical protein
MVKVQDSDKYGLKRLESKNARNAIIKKLAVQRKEAEFRNQKPEKCG